MSHLSKVYRKFLLYALLPSFAVLCLGDFVPFHGTRLGLPLFLLLLLAAFLFLSWAFIRIVVQPLRQIQEGSLNFLEGRFNHKIRLGLRKDELGEIADGLNEMSEQVQGKIQSLAKDLAASQALLGGMQEGVLILDAKGRVQRMNDAMEAILFPFSVSEAGKHYLEVFRDPDLNDLIQQTYAGKKPQRRQLSLLGNKFFQVQSSLIRNGGVKGVVVVFHDVTDLKRLERVRQEFVANVSHELRTPLTAIKGYTEALLDGGLQDPAQADGFLKIIDRHAGRMEKIVGDLLTLAEVESADRAMKKDSLSLAELIRSAADSLRPQAMDKKQSLELRIPADVPSIWGDGPLVLQVLVNLLQNAIRYTPEEGRVFVEVRPVPRGAEIEVADNGIGIPPEDLSRIFERFYRVDKGRSRDLGGTGLGLSIVKHIVEAHGGSVRVESKLGVGSRFIVQLPSR